MGQGCGWKQVTGPQVADMCWGLATARHCTPALPAATQQLSLQDLDGLKPRLVTAMLWGCAVLLQQPKSVIAQLTITLSPEGKGAGTAFS